MLSCNFLTALVGEKGLVYNEDVWAGNLQVTAEEDQTSEAKSCL